MLTLLSDILIIDYCFSAEEIDYGDFTIALKTAARRMNLKDDEGLLMIF